MSCYTFVGENEDKQRSGMVKVMFVTMLVNLFDNIDIQKDHGCNVANITGEDGLFNERRNLSTSIPRNTCGSRDIYIREKYHLTCKLNIYTRDYIPVILVLILNIAFICKRYERSKVARQ